MNLTMTNLETMCATHSEVPERSAKPTLPARVLVKGVRGYQYLRAGHVSPCRFVPSCSQYALEALEVYGAFKGSFLATKRVLRCNPFGSHGVDLVPLPREKRS